jgi:prophage DNA circulation protein
MKRSDVNEAAPILERMLALLVSFVPAKGRPGVDARTAIGDLRANARALCGSDALGPPLDNCFEQARLAGVTWQQLETVRESVDAETPVTLGGALVQNCGVRLCLAVIAEVVSDATFVSRQQVDALRLALRQPFKDAEEVAADEMDQMTFQTLIQTQGALTNHLVQTALPLPRMMKYEFYNVQPSLVLAYRLYADGSRCDEVRAENKIVHPAFCPLTGLALSQ